MKHHRTNMSDRFRRLISYDPLAGLNRKKRASGGSVKDISREIEEQAKLVNTNPSERQKESGVYRKGHVQIHGLDISIENPRGSWRTGGPEGARWRSRLPNHYGYIRKTEGGDGDHVDCYIGPHLKSPHVFVVDQHDLGSNKWDEHKAFIGFGSEKQARDAYHRAFSDGRGRDRIGHVETLSVPMFKLWLQHGNTKAAIKRATGGSVKKPKKFADFRRSDNIEDRREDKSPVEYKPPGFVAEPWQSEQIKATQDDNPLAKDLGIQNVYDKHASGGRIHKAGGGAMSDADMGLAPAASSAMSDSDMGIASTQQPPHEKTWSERLSNAWEHATPGGPLWLTKQALEGMHGAVQSAADEMSTPATEEEAFRQNQGREHGPGYALQAAQVLTPSVPGGTGGLLAAPLRAAEKIVSPIVSGNKAAAQEFGINLSKGQSAQDLDAIRYEDMASRGAYGPEQQQRAAAFFNKQHQDIEAGGQSVGQQTARTAPVVDTPSDAASSVSSEIFDRAARLREAQAAAERQSAAESETQRGMVGDQGRALTDAIRGGALPIENPREAGEIVGQNVRDAAAENRAEFQARYREFGELPGQFDVSAVRGMGDRLRNELTYGNNPVVIDDHLTPSSSRAIQALDQMSAPRIQNRASPHAEPNPQDVTAVSLQGVDQMRKQLVAYYQAARSSGNGSDIRAMRSIMNGFDGQIERAITENLFSGDPRALTALQEARASYSRYQRTYSPQGAGDDVGTAMRRIVDRNATPEETANMIIGSGKIGNSGLPVRIADRLEQVLGADSDSWSALRQAMWQKASQVRNTAGEIDPTRSAQNITDFTGSSLARRMFTDQERAAMRSHAQGIRDLDRNIEQLPAVQNATRSRQAYQDTFGGAELGGAPKAAFQKMVEGTATPEEITNGVFKVIGAGNPGHAARALQAIERIVGPDSDAMAAVRQGVWQKLTQAAAGKDQPGAQKKMQAINEFLSGTGKTIAEQLYSPNELALMQRYADAIKLTIIPPRAATRSDTAVASFAAARKYAGMVGAALGLVHGDGGLAGYAVGKLLDKAGEKVTGMKEMRKLSDSLDDIDRTVAGSSTMGKRPMPSRAIRKEAPFSLNLTMPRLQGPVPAGADDEKNKSKRP